MTERGRAEAVTVITEKERAEKVRKLIMINGLFDPGRSIGRGRRVHFPVIIPSGRGRDWISSLLGPVDISSDTCLTPHRTTYGPPFERIRSRLGGSLSEEELDHLPDRWERVGDCLILSTTAGGKEKEIARVYMDVLGARYVLGREGGVRGELREPSLRTLIAPPDGRYEVVHKEGPCKFCLDPRKVMLSSGNVDIRLSFPDMIRQGVSPPRLQDVEGHLPGSREVVLDMFAGIGYFTIPTALLCNPARILSVEKNPVSFGYLKENIELNGVGGVVEPIPGDNRKVTPKGIADRVIMGYVGGTVEYLPTALDGLVPQGGILHLHDTVKIEEGPGGLFEKARIRAGRSGFDVFLLKSRRVKSYAPRIDHLVLDILALPL